MNLQHRIDLLNRLGEYILENNEEWQIAKENAGHENGWFTPEFRDHATNTIACTFLKRDILQKWIASYPLHEETDDIKIGVVMAGNIPLAGFHDWLSVFVSGHHAVIKPSSKDTVMIQHLTDKMISWDNNCNLAFHFAGMLKGCDGYIATGSNNSSRYFAYYFDKYPHIIRRNRTSVAILTGDETNSELEKLADDVFLYFGLGCRNVTQIYIPRKYDFLPLLAALKKYQHLVDHHKYKNNYDYNLALDLLNKVEYMTNGSVLLVEDERLFSPIGQLNYAYYSDKGKLITRLQSNPDLQCIVGNGFVPFGSSQLPAIDDYADGVDTLAFLAALRNGDKKP